MKTLSQNSERNCRDLNKAPHDYTKLVLPLDQPELGLMAFSSKMVTNEMKCIMCGSNVMVQKSLLLLYIQDVHRQNLSLMTRCSDDVFCGFAQTLQAYVVTSL
jgi:hypothetical protein